MGILQKSETIGKLSAALAKAQAEIKGAAKDSVNPHFRSKFADLESCWDSLREPLAKNGLSVIQLGGFDKDAGPTIITTLAHESGEWISGEAPLHPKSMTPQDLGSAITYGRRYWLCAITGLYPADDDGETAMARPQQSNTAARTNERTGTLGRQLDQGPPPGRFDGPPPELKGPPRR